MGSQPDAEAPPGMLEQWDLEGSLCPVSRSEAQQISRSNPAFVKARMLTGVGSGNRAMARSIKAATWLILPVVICLSQRLSHACLSINCFIL